MANEVAERFILIHTHENIDDTQFLVEAPVQFRTKHVDLLVFYLQTIAADIDDSFMLLSEEVATILTSFYQFKDLGRLPIVEAAKQGRVLDDAWMGTVREPHFTVIDIFENWEQHWPIYEVVNSAQFYHRDGVKEHIQKLYDAERS